MRETSSDLRSELLSFSVNCWQFTTAIVVAHNDCRYLNVAIAVVRSNCRHLNTSIVVSHSN